MHAKRTAAVLLLTVMAGTAHGRPRDNWGNSGIMVHSGDTVTVAVATNISVWDDQRAKFIHFRVSGDRVLLQRSRGTFRKARRSRGLCAAVGRKSVTIRLSKVHCPRPGQAFAKEAICFARERVLRRRVDLKTYKKDRLGRRLGDLRTAKSIGRRHEKRWLSSELVAAGLAWTDRRAKDKHLAMLQAEAKRARRGVWSLAKPVPPWEFAKARESVTSKTPKESRGMAQRGALASTRKRIARLQHELSKEKDATKAAALKQQILQALLHDTTWPQNLRNYVRGLRKRNLTPVSVIILSDLYDAAVSGNAAAMDYLCSVLPAVPLFVQVAPDMLCPSRSCEKSVEAFVRRHGLISVDVARLHRLRGAPKGGWLRLVRGHGGAGVQRGTFHSGGKFIGYLSTMRLVGAWAAVRTSPTGETEVVWHGETLAHQIDEFSHSGIDMVCKPKYIAFLLGCLDFYLAGQTVSALKSPVSGQDRKALRSADAAFFDACRDVLLRSSLDKMDGLKRFVSEQPTNRRLLFIMNPRTFKGNLKCRRGARSASGKRDS